MNDIINEDIAEYCESEVCLVTFFTIYLNIKNMFRNCCSLVKYNINSCVKLNARQSPIGVKALVYFNVAFNSRNIEYFREST